MNYSEYLEKLKSTTGTAKDYALHPPFPTRRSSVIATRGMVACNQPLAAEAGAYWRHHTSTAHDRTGIRVLREGGNAADAAVAVAAALNVTEPCATGACCVYHQHRATKPQPQAWAGTRLRCFTTPRQSASSVPWETAAPQRPSTSTPSAPRKTRLVACRRFTPSLQRSASGICIGVRLKFLQVPGAAACWEATVQQWGRLPLAKVLEPAIELAEGGFAVQPVTAFWWRKSARQLQDTPGDGCVALLPSRVNHASGRAALLNEDGEGPAPGQRMTNPDLANTMRLLGKHGAAQGAWLVRWCV